MERQAELDREKEIQRARKQREEREKKKREEIAERKRKAAENERKLEAEMKQMDFDRQRELMNKDSEKMKNIFQNKKKPERTAVAPKQPIRTKQPKQKIGKFSNNLHAFPKHFSTN